jgi:hypothetical protein
MSGLGVATLPREKMNKSIGVKVNELHDIREKIREQEAKTNELKKKYTALSDEVMDTMEEQGVDQIRGTKATLSLKKTDVANVLDWEKVYNYIHRHKAYHLMFRRIADASFREELELRGKRGIPGIEIFTRRSCGLLKSK